jgi:hypothetical protein
MSAATRTATPERPASASRSRWPGCAVWWAERPISKPRNPALQPAFCRAAPDLPGRAAVFPEESKSSWRNRFFLGKIRSFPENIDPSWKRADLLGRSQFFPQAAESSETPPDLPVSAVILPLSRAFHRARPSFGLKSRPPKRAARSRDEIWRTGSSSEDPAPAPAVRASVGKTTVRSRRRRRNREPVSQVNGSAPP